MINYLELKRLLYNCTELKQCEEKLKEAGIIFEKQAPGGILPSGKIVIKDTVSGFWLYVWQKDAGNYLHLQVGEAHAGMDHYETIFAKRKTKNNQRNPKDGVSGAK